MRNSVHEPLYAGSLYDPSCTYRRSCLHPADLWTGGGMVRRCHQYRDLPSVFPAWRAPVARRGDRGHSALASASGHPIDDLRAVPAARPCNRLHPREHPCTVTLYRHPLPLRSALDYPVVHRLYLDGWRQCSSRNLRGFRLQYSGHVPDTAPRGPSVFSLRQRRRLFLECAAKHSRAASPALHRRAGAPAVDRQLGSLA